MSPDGLALLLLYAVAAARGCVSSRDGSGVDDDSSRRRIIRHSSDSGSDSNGGNSLGCGGIPGECRGGRRLSVSSSSVMTSHFDCLVECQRTAGCTHYTYFGGGGGGGADEEEEGVCLTFDGCPEVDQSSCSTDGAGFGGGGGCVSGDRDCVEEQCFFLGSCQGRLMGSQIAANASECLRMCRVNPNCAWFGFDPAMERCAFTSSCFPVDRGGAGAAVVSGRADCTG